MKKFTLLLTLIVVTNLLMAQSPDTTKHPTVADSLFNSMNANNPRQNVPVFSSSRLILSQTTETVKKNNLNFLVLHHFGDFAGSAGGGKTFFGLDAIADVYIGFEYGITNNLNIDIGRSTIPLTGGLAQLELKYALVHQTSDGSSPLAITILGETGAQLYNSFPTFGDRLAYFGEAIFARKFSHDFSLQLAPSIVQDNLPIPNAPGNEETFFSLTASTQIKVSKIMSIVVDYAHPFSSYRSAHGYSDPVGLGLQVVTGGHVFTINVTNAKAVSEVNYLSNTQSDFSEGQFRLGFTISRMFDFNHKEHYTPKR